MSKFTIMVLTDSSEMSTQVVSAVNQIGEANDEAKRCEEIQRVIDDQNFVVASAIENDRGEIRKRLYSLKIGPAFIEPGASHKFVVDARVPLNAVNLKIPSDLVTDFVVEDLFFTPIPVEESEKKFRRVETSSNPVPAAVFSDEAADCVDLNVDFRRVTLVVRNLGKRKVKFRASIVGFRKDQVSL